MAVEGAPSYAELQQRLARVERELAEARERESGAAGEIAPLRRDLAEALRQQAAAAEVLKVISRSTFDLQVVLDTLIANGVRLCGAERGTVFRIDGKSLRLAASYNMTPELVDFVERHPIPLSRGSMGGRVALERRTVHIPDVLADPEYDYLAHQVGKGYRTVLGTPMLRGDELFGLISIYNPDVRPFSQRQIELLETFANQAVIAIENNRLFQEVEERNRNLTETLEQQTATSEILRVISQSPTDLQAVLEAIIENATRLSGADQAAIHRADEEVYRPAAASGVSGAFWDFFVRNPIHPGRGSVLGRAALERRTIHVADVLADPEYERRDLQKASGYRTVLAVPMLREGVLVGIFALTRREVEPFTNKQIQLVTTFADQAVIAIENTRLFRELQERNRDLTEALEQQTATSEVLRVISSSPTALPAVYDVILERVTRLCEADIAALFLYGGESLAAVASRGTTPRFAEHLQHSRPRPSRETTTRLAALELRPVHVTDLLNDPQFAPRPRDLYEDENVRTVLSVPMLRDDRLIGVLTTWRREVRPFAERQVALLQTFADQAVIAVENARLFRELEARVDELQALGEVSRAVVSSLDLAHVLETIVAHAVELIGADGGAIYEHDEARQEFLHRATYGLADDLNVVLPTAPLRLDEGAVGAAGATRSPVQIADILAEGAYESRLREQLLTAGFRSILAVPLLAEGRVLGALVVSRKQPGEFPPATVELLQTFASQSALAIQNARLFREIEAKSQELAVASRHKSEFLANMSHELRTPLNAIIGFSEVLVERMFGDINEKQEEYLHDVLASGQHLLSLINDILDLSKVEAGRMELELGEFSLRQALENGLTMLKERASRHGITLGLEIEPGLDLVEADERKVKQVVFNLLSNAVKFTPDGGSISASGRVVEGDVQISVWDTGIGIAPEDLPHVFDEFRQVGQGEAKTEGTGLGLALARKFVELHGGQIWVESEPGTGSTFTFALPQPPVVHRTEASR